MGISVQNNLGAMNAQRNMGVANGKLSKAMEKLSTGFRINRAADDAAGLAISEKMRAQIKGLNRASKNATDGISLIQTAEGAMATVHDALGRMETLATQAANGTLKEEDKEKAQAEVDQLLEEINRIADTTEFNTMKLLNGDLKSRPGLQVTSTGGNTIINASKAVFDTREGKYAPISASAGAGASSIIGKDQGLSSKLAGFANVGVVVGSATAASAAGISIAVSSIASATAGAASAGSALGVQVSADGTLFTKEIAVSGAIANGSFYIKETTYGSALTDISFDVEVNGKMQAVTLDLAGTGSVWNDFTNELAALTENTTTRYGANEVSKVISSLENVINQALTNKQQDLSVNLSIDANGRLNLSSSDGNTQIKMGTDVKSVAFFGALFGETALKTEAAKAFTESGVDVKSELLMKLNGATYKLDLKSVSTMVSDIKAGENADNFASQVKIALRSAITEMMTQQGLTAGKDGFIDVNGIDVSVNAQTGKIELYIPGKGVDLEFSGSFADQFGITGAVNLNESTAYPDNGMILQIGANENQTMVFTIEDMHTDNIGLKGIDLTSEAAAGASLTKVQSAINFVSEERSKLGAVQNRLEYTITNLDTTAENLQSSESLIRDADMADEVMKQTQNNVLQQVAQAMLAQANQQPQSVLQLLG